MSTQLDTYCRLTRSGIFEDNYYRRQCENIEAIKRFDKFCLENNIEDSFETFDIFSDYYFKRFKETWEIINKLSFKEMKSILILYSLSK
jgi:hypothetical protein